MEIKYLGIYSVLPWGPLVHFVNFYAINVVTTQKSSLPAILVMGWGYLIDVSVSLIVWNRLYRTFCVISLILVVSLDTHPLKTFETNETAFLTSEADFIWVLLLWFYWNFQYLSIVVEVMVSWTKCQWKGHVFSRWLDYKDGRRVVV